MCVCGCRCGKKYVGLFLMWQHPTQPILAGIHQSITWVQKPQSAKSGLKFSFFDTNEMTYHMIWG
jgi:hypothetical protein